MNAEEVKDECFLSDEDFRRELSGLYRCYPDAFRHVKRVDKEVFDLMLKGQQIDKYCLEKLREAWLLIKNELEEQGSEQVKKIVVDWWVNNDWLILATMALINIKIDEQA
jgi:hypothetical protein